MRILFVSESFPPVVSGVAVTVSRAVADMKRRGHTVAVITPLQEGVPEDADYAGCRVYRVPSVPNPVRKGLRFTVGGIFSAAPAFDDFRPDIVHINDVGLLCMRSVSLARKRGIPVVATQHFTFEGISGYLPSAAPAPALMKALRRSAVYMFNRCDLVTVPSFFMRGYVGKWPGLKAPVRVIHNGVDVERFVPGDPDPALRRSLDVPEGVPVVGYIGRIDQEKNIATFLRAFIGACRQRPLHAILVGGGGQVEALKELVREAGLAESVSWVPPLKYDSPELPEHYRLFDIFCMPSPFETESMVTLEAMASGLPVIGADGAAVTELVDAANGMAVPPYDEALWRQAILQAVTASSACRKEWSAESRERAMGRELRSCLGEMEAAYVGLAGTGSEAA